MRKLISFILCLTMILGSAASAFAKETSQGTATTLRLEKTEGSVAVTKSGKTVKVKDGGRLYDGYQIKTGTKSAAYVSLDSSKAIMMDASTDISIKKNGSKLEIMLKSGTILVNVDEKLKSDEELNIRTTNSVTGIRGTTVQEKFNPVTQNTELYVFEGHVSGTYQAPDGTFYVQELSTGTWLASGTGMLSDHPEENGWKYVEDHWVYTNNDIEGSGGSGWCWSQDKGWYSGSSHGEQSEGAQGGQTEGTQENAQGSTQESQESSDAWQFKFSQLEPKTRQEIIDSPEMLKKGQEHLDIYPELAEDKKEEAEQSAQQDQKDQQKETEQKEKNIEEAFTEGNGGKTTVDNLFEEASYIPSAPTYTVSYYYDSTKETLITTRSYVEGQTIEPPYYCAMGYYTPDWYYLDAKTGQVTKVTEGAIMGTTAMDIWADPSTIYPLPMDVTINYLNGADTVATLAPVAGTYESVSGNTYEVTYQKTFKFTVNNISDGEPALVRVTDDQPSSDGQAYEAGDGGVYSIKITNASGVNIYILPIYAANYYPNSDLGEEELINTVYYGEGETIAAQKDLIRGYTVNGWLYRDPLTEEDTPVSTMGNANIDCWPDPEKTVGKTITVSFDKNNTSATGSIASVSYVYGSEESDSLPSSGEGSFQLTGSYITGWSLNSEATTADYTCDTYYTAIEDDLLDNMNKDGVVTLYAVWAPATYSVTLNTSGGAINSGNVKSYTYGVGAILPTAVTKDYHNFDGWYESSDFIGTSVSAISAADFGDKIYYAKWIPVDYTVTLFTNGGTINSGNIAGYSYGTATALPTDISKDNHDFTGWYDNENLAGTSVAAISASDSGNKQFWAGWTPKTYQKQVSVPENVTLTAISGGTYDSAKSTASVTYGTDFVFTLETEDETDVVIVSAGGIQYTPDADKQYTIPVTDESPIYVMDRYKVWIDIPYSYYGLNKQEHPATDFAHITSFSSNVIHWEKDDEFYTIDVLGDKKISITVECENVGGVQYGVESTTAEVTEYEYGKYIWHLDIEESTTYINIEQVYDVAMGGSTDYYSVTNAVANTGEVYSFVDSNIEITSTKAQTEDQLACVYYIGGVEYYCSDFNFNEKTHTADLTSFIYIDDERCPIARYNIYYNEDGIACVELNYDDSSDFHISGGFLNDLVSEDWDNDNGSVYCLVPYDSDIKITTNEEDKDYHISVYVDETLWKPEVTDESCYVIPITTFNDVSVYVAQTHTISYYTSDELGTPFQTDYYTSGQAIDLPEEIVPNYTTPWLYQADADSEPTTIPEVMGSSDIECWPDYANQVPNTYTYTITKDDDNVAYNVVSGGSLITSSGSSASYTVSYGTPLVLSSATANLMKLTVTGGATDKSVPAVDNGSTTTYTIDIYEAGDRTIHVSDVPETQGTVAVKFSQQYDSYTIDNTSSNVVSISKNENLPGYILGLDDSEPATFRIALMGGTDGSPEYAIEKVTKTNGPAEETLDADEYKVYSGTYTTDAENVNVTISEVYRAVYGAGLNTIYQIPEEGFDYSDSATNTYYYFNPDLICVELIAQGSAVPTEDQLFVMADDLTAGSVSEPSFGFYVSDGYLYLPKFGSNGGKYDVYYDKDGFPSVEVNYASAKDYSVTGSDGVIASVASLKGAPKTTYYMPAGTSFSFTTEDEPYLVYGSSWTKSGNTYTLNVKEDTVLNIGEPEHPENTYLLSINMGSLNKLGGYLTKITNVTPTAIDGLYYAASMANVEIEASIPAGAGVPYAKGGAMTDHQVTEDDGYYLVSFSALMTKDLSYSFAAFEENQLALVSVILQTVDGDRAQIPGITEGSSEPSEGIYRAYCHTSENAEITILDWNDQAVSDGYQIDAISSGPATIDSSLYTFEGGVLTIDKSCLQANNLAENHSGITVTISPTQLPE